MCSTPNIAPTPPWWPYARLRDVGLEVQLRVLPGKTAFFVDQESNLGVEGTSTTPYSPNNAWHIAFNVCTSLSA